MKPKGSGYPRIRAKAKTGQEPIENNGQGIGVSLLDFWRWNTSDLISNATRGCLAEYIVGLALGCVLDVRDEWGAYDLTTPEGIKVEVKSAAYIQTWYQPQLSPIVFGVPKTRFWDPDTGQIESEARRHADVYVFALLAHQDQETLDPLHLDQWEFYVLPTRVLDERTRSQHSITLASLKKLSGGKVPFSALRASVLNAAQVQGVYRRP